MGYGSICCANQNVWESKNRDYPDNSITEKNWRIIIITGMLKKLTVPYSVAEASRYYDSENSKSMKQDDKGLGNVMKQK